MKEFLTRYYKKGDIVYPNAVARHCRINTMEAYQLCDIFLGKELKLLYQVTCPLCNCNADMQRFYSVNEVSEYFGDEVNCCNCDNTFKLDINTNVRVAYEKL